jgi:uncharacterized protein YndB with AHSA1/START domain
MTTEPERRLRLTRRFDASAERVFAAWLDPALVSQWLFTTPMDEAYTAELDPRAGGQWRITARRGGDDYTASGEYLEIDPPRRLVFTFAMLQFSPNSDRITIEVAPSGTGCMLTLTQEGIDIAAEVVHVPAGAQGGTEMGWNDMFDRLTQALL